MGSVELAGCLGWTHDRFLQGEPEGRPSLVDTIKRAAGGVLLSQGLRAPALLALVPAVLGCVARPGVGSATQNGPVNERSNIGPVRRSLAVAAAAGSLTEGRKTARAAGQATQSACCLMSGHWNGEVRTRYMLELSTSLN